MSDNLVTFNIPIENIHPHPDNPRKDLGDITELTESIRKNGIMQNLSVIPMEGKEDEYMLVIGHRRCAAAKAAGLKEVPCRIINDLEYKEQLAVMLEENMQRNDLTIIEQADCFQMMLDLGEDIETLERKTGFSKQTIKHRVEIAKLDKKILREKESQEAFQLSITDLYELEKIKDIKSRNKVMKEANSSRDIARLTLNTINEQKRQENYKLFEAALKSIGIMKAPKEANNEFYNNKWERMEDYDLNKKPPKKFKFNDNGEQIYYLERYGRLCIIRKAKKEKKVLTPAEQEKKEHERDKRQLKAILKEASNTRKEFIEGIISGKIKAIKDAKVIEEELFEQILDWESFVGHNTLKEFFLGCECYKAEKEDIEKAEKKMEGLSLLHKLLCVASAKVAGAELMEWNYHYRTITGNRVMKFYEVLEKFGFAFPNDEQKGAVDGTSNLYVKEKNNG